jgi:transcriptional regulator with XRE-family HTH domain
MAELLQAIGHNIRRLRDEKGWNQTELGFRAGASPSIISLIENGKRNPSTATLAKIAEALDVDVVDLFPKGPSSSLEPTLLNGLEDERRSQHLGIWKSYLSRRVEWCEKELQRSREETFSPFRSLDTAMQWTIYVVRETDHLRTALRTEIRSYTDTDSEIVGELHALVDRFMAVSDASAERVKAMFEEAELTDEDKKHRLRLIRGSAA